MKTKEMEAALNAMAMKMFGRQRIDGKCVTCGKSVDIADFRDTLSVKEYGISRMCQKCQDSVFGSEEPC